MKMKPFIMAAAISLSISTVYAQSDTHSLAYTMEDAYNALPAAGTAGLIAQPLTDSGCNPSKFSITSQFYLNGKNVKSDASDHINIDTSGGALFHTVHNGPEQADRIKITVNATCSDNTPISFSKVVNIEPRDHLIYRIDNAATYDPLTNSPEFGGIGTTDKPKIVDLIETKEGPNRMRMSPGPIPSSKIDNWGTCTYTMSDQDQAKLSEIGLAFDTKTNTGTIAGIPVQPSDPTKDMTVIVKAACTGRPGEVIGASLNFVVSKSSSK